MNIDAGETVREFYREQGILRAVRTLRVAQHSYCECPNEDDPEGPCTPCQLVSNITRSLMAGIDQRRHPNATWQETK